MKITCADHFNRILGADLYACIWRNYKSVQQGLIISRSRVILELPYMAVTQTLRSLSQMTSIVLFQGRGFPHEQNYIWLIAGGVWSHNDVWSLVTIKWWPDCRLSQYPLYWMKWQISSSDNSRIRSSWYSVALNRLIGPTELIEFRTVQKHRFTRVMFSNTNNWVGSEVGFSC